MCIRDRFRIALSLAALAGNDDGQAILPAQLVAHVPYAVIAPFVGIVFVVVYKIYGAENNVIVDVSFVNVRREYIFMLPLCYRVGKLLSDFKMCIRDRQREPQTPANFCPALKLWRGSLCRHTPQHWTGKRDRKSVV